MGLTEITQRFTEGIRALATRTGDDALRDYRDLLGAAELDYRSFASRVDDIVAPSTDAANFQRAQKLGVTELADALGSYANGNGSYGTAAAAIAQPAIAVPPGRGATPAAAPLVVQPSDGRFFGRTFESLRVPSFRWYFVAQFGTWGAMNMQMVVNGYLVFILTGSFAALGLSALARSLPGIVFALVGGVLADRLPKKYLIQAGQTVSGLVALWVAIMLVFGWLRFEHLLLLLAVGITLFVPRLRRLD